MIILISIALCVGYGGALISARVAIHNPLVSGIDRSNDNKWFLPAKLFNSDLSRPVVRRKQNVSGIDVSPVLQVIATATFFHPKRFTSHEQKKTAHTNSDMKRGLPSNKN